MSPSLSRRLSAYSRELNFLLKAVAVCVLSALCVVMPAGAVSGNDVKPEQQITLTPTKQRLELKKGQTYKGSFKVINSGWKSLDFKVYAAPFQVSDQSYDPIFNKTTPRTQLSRWVKFDNTDYTAEPEEVVDVNYTVNVPESIPDGSQYAVIFAEATGESQTDSSIVSKQRVGTLLYARTDGKTVEQGEAKIGNAGLFTTGNKITVPVEAKNTGNTDFDTQVKAEVNSIFGGKAKKVFENQFAVLPDTTRQIQATWDDASFGIYQVKTNVTQLNNTKTGQQWLVVIPQAIIYIIVILFILILGGIIYAKTRTRK